MELNNLLGHITMLSGTEALVKANEAIKKNDHIGHDIERDGNGLASCLTCNENCCWRCLKGISEDMSACERHDFAF